MDELPVLIPYFDEPIQISSLNPPRLRAYVDERCQLATIYEVEENSNDVNDQFDTDIWDFGSLDDCHQDETENVSNEDNDEDKHVTIEVPASFYSKGLSFMNSEIMKLLDTYAPLKKRIVSGKSEPWFTSEIKELCKAHDCAKLKAALTNSQHDKKIVNRLRNRVNNSIASTKRKYLSKKFAESCKSENMWESINLLTKFRVKKRSPISFLELGKKRIYDNTEINDALANEFVVKETTIVEPLDGLPTEKDILKGDINEYRINFSYEETKVSDKEPLRVTKIEVEDALRSVKSKRSHNPPDLVPVSVMKQLSSVFVFTLTLLFTRIINSQSVPNMFKRAVIAPLYKGKGSRNIAGNYRPISLLNDYCKIFEKFLAKRLNDRVEAKLSPNQHAYRRNMSCHSALSILTNDIFKSIDKPKQKVGAIFIDFRKAFDSVSHTILTKKLMCEYQLEPWYVETINNNMENRVFSFDFFSKQYPLTRGICQGSAKGPLAFSLFINDISRIIQCAHLMYADDIVIYVEGTSLAEISAKLISEMERVMDWCNENQVNINFEKTHCMFFHKNHDNSIKSESLESICVRNHVIQRVYTFKYLGVTLDPCLTFEEHYKLVSQKLARKIKYLRGFKRFLTDKVMKLMVNAHLHSVLDYALDIWACISDDKLEKLQSKIDNFLLEFYFPILNRKRRTSKIQKEQVDKIRSDLNFMTVKQRREYVLLKNTYIRFKKGELNLFGRQSSRKIPLVRLTNFNSNCFKCSSFYRGAIMWNKLPKELNPDLGYEHFKNQVKEFCIKNIK
ncbi:unnamed protein product [Orchesella dallaii]|uniref:Reverse transcriptase domain-containing protein n=1 Tax=Orchesella dallaii TaxID=48710 RepID=A0ABP1PTI2_9HEXA